jgi:hypothetical protein
MIGKMMIISVISLQIGYGNMWVWVNTYRYILVG